LGAGQTRTVTATSEIESQVPDGTVIQTVARVAAANGTLAVANHAFRIGNSPPRLAPIADQVVNEGVTLNLTATATDRDVPAAQRLTFSLVNAPAGASINSSTGAFSWTPSESQGPGVYPITVRVTDNGTPPYSNEVTFTVTVNEVNAPPTFVKGSNVLVLEDAPPQVLVAWATGITVGPPGDAGVEVEFLVDVDRSELFSGRPTISPTGTLTFATLPNVSGVATVTVRLRDDGGTAHGGVDTSAAQTFTIAIQPVNDAPSFMKGADQTVLEDAGPQSVAGWATAIRAGPADEAGQTLTFVVATDQPALFAAGPAVAANGTLTYTPAADANGTASVTVTLKDDGGTAHGGVDTSAAQTFTIRVMPRDKPLTVAVSKISKQSFELTWPTKAGRRYQVFTKQNLDDAEWLPSGPVISGSGSEVIANVEINNASRGFYLVVELP
jgi:hypothetical protein